MVHAGERLRNLGTIDRADSYWLAEPLIYRTILFLLIRCPFIAWGKH